MRYRGEYEGEADDEHHRPGEAEAVILRLGARQEKQGESCLDLVREGQTGYGLKSSLAMERSFTRISELKTREPTVRARQKTTI